MTISFKILKENKVRPGSLYTQNLFQEKKKNYESYFRHKDEDQSGCQRMYYQMGGKDRKQELEEQRNR